MQQIIQSIQNLYKNWRGKDAASIDVLPQSGSERRYFRIHEDDGKTIIGTYGANIKENETFFYFSENFFDKNLPVANILDMIRMYVNGGENQGRKQGLVQLVCPF